MKVKSLSHIRLFATSWSVAHQAPPSMGFSRQEYWSGLPFPSPLDYLLTEQGVSPVVNTNCWKVETQLHKITEQATWLKKVAPSMSLFFDLLDFN